MPDDASTADTTTTDTTADTTDTAAKTFTQEQVNTFLAENRRNGVTPAEIEALKVAAAELATIKDAQKSTEQRAADRTSAADAEIAKIPAKVSDALRVHLVALHKIPAEDAELFLTASDPEVLLKQVERLVARGAEDVAASKKHGNFVAREGSTSHSADSDELETARALFGSN
jgi:hypothetical protein